MKKLVSVLIILVLMFSLFGCDRKYDEEEVKAAARELISESAVLNDVFWGKGIGYINDVGTSSGYLEANPDDLKKLGIETIEDLKHLTREVYSQKYSEHIFGTVLSAYGDGNGVFGLTRYYQKYSDGEGLEPECIMVYKDANILLKDDIRYLLDTVEVTHSEKKTVYVNITVEVTRGADTQTRVIEKIGLIEEENGWRLDTPTYISYDEEFEKQN